MIISLEGLDGSGKTYFAMLLKRELEKKNLSVYYVHESGSFSEIRLSPYLDFSESTTRDLLYTASALSLIKKIRTFSEDDIVVVDRYVDSMIAYLDYSKKDWESDLVCSFVKKVCSFAPRPDLTIFLDLSKSVIFQRRLVRGENMDWNYEEKVLSRFWKRVVNDPERFVVISNEDVSIIEDIVEKILVRRRK